jgi:hypothetical protein
VTAGNDQYVELRIFERIAEQTGATEPWANVRTRRGVCRSLTQLRSKCRELGDGYYYIRASSWPQGITVLNLAEPSRKPSAALATGE